MSPEKKDAVINELKRIAQALNLSDSQKEQLRTQLADKQAKLQDFRTQHPDIPRTELIQEVTSMRRSLRAEVVKFLTPQQLEKWDTEVSKAREFLGQNIAA